MKKLPLVVIGVLACSLVGCFEAKRGPVKKGNHVHGAANRGNEMGRFTAGQFVVTIVDNASFFHELPMGEVMPDLFLMKGMSLRIIAPGDTYSKVELDDGRIGYVMTAMMVPFASSAPPTGAGEIVPPPPPPRPGGMPPLIDPGLPPVLPGE